MSLALRPYRMFVLCLESGPNRQPCPGHVQWRSFGIGHGFGTQCSDAVLLRGPDAHVAWCTYVHMYVFQKRRTG